MEEHAEKLEANMREQGIFSRLQQLEKQFEELAAMERKQEIFASIQQMRSMLSSWRPRVRAARAGPAAGRAADHNQAHQQESSVSRPSSKGAA